MHVPRRSLRAMTKNYRGRGGVGVEAENFSLKFLYDVDEEHSCMGVLMQKFSDFVN